MRHGRLARFESGARCGGVRAMSRRRLPASAADAKTVGFAVVAETSWMPRCPTDDDREPSLPVRDGHEGQLTGPLPCEQARGGTEMPLPGAGDTSKFVLLTADTESAITQCMPVRKIRVGKRHRKAMGDLHPLATSMDVLGLLHPIVVTPDGLLLCGERRLAAAKLLGWETIPVTIRSKP